MTIWVIEAHRKGTEDEWVPVGDYFLVNQYTEVEFAVIRNNRLFSKFEHRAVPYDRRESNA